MLSLYFGLAIFCFIASVTPGPNNIILIIATHRAGLVGAIPVLLGICVGFSIMLACSGVVLGYLNQNIYVHNILAVVSLCFLLYVCYCIFKMNINDKLVDDDAKSKDFNFFTASLFQWINPKAWIICSAAAATYVKADMGYGSVFLTAFVMSILGCTPWLVLGSYLDQILNTTLKKSIFFKSMAVILLVTVLYSYLA
ncbi:LysE family translocator [Acinetobacter rathckeae]|uniref:LysE family translocator n=1 Tax=Acinetobacter rathckeae TaxID=2605272 RepID=UPI0018A30D2F|nr:LysE family transporter [Acinetobacter rathckeae]MBF7687561.1 LysE family transporter [Acinetobacter rathckeae]MBF7694963.1 LysE family transporter [Acinetobacter rathckeae]